MNPTYGYEPHEPFVTVPTRSGVPLTKAVRASSNCPLCGVGTPHDHSRNDLAILRAKVAFLESKWPAAREQASTPDRFDAKDEALIRKAMIDYHNDESKPKSLRDRAYAIFQVMRMEVGEQASTPRAEPVLVSVARMSESHRVTYWTQLRRGDATYSIRQYSEEHKNRADYEAASLRHFFGQGPKPDVLAYVDTPPPSTAPEATPEKRPDHACPFCGKPANPASSIRTCEEHRKATPEKLAAPTPAAPSAEPDMIAVCAALGFDPTNHHNAARCPYCTPAVAPAAQRELTANERRQIEDALPKVGEAEWLNTCIEGGILRKLYALATLSTECPKETK